ncbi:SRPBCC family protein [Flavobacterium pallidum]|uniref:Cell division inhibitor n=1 Tax=Flavobacterium pallidum TaxID=2172098 RepID=A0A2S1SKB3_9FLAO|nr:SRPBCC family protein [Flavobacterium pallidum]AWI26796.1 hypothetical protein HYN49_13310 [Flavobacterium pallidum]
MAIYQFTQQQKIPVALDTIWAFISNPENLKEITPPHMGFKIIGGTGQGKIYQGMIIRYIVKPLLGIPLQWVTEITHMKECEYFVDEQRAGPYKLWHHQHKIEAIAGGVLMTDIVSYIPPFGFIGRIANSVLIKKQLQQIFEFRTKAINEKFGPWQD